jgi:lactate dehydrogenase-like 2-hydroxyacid dehydrogenase
MARLISDADVVVGYYTFRIKIDASLCEKMKKVRLIQQPNTGYDHIGPARGGASPWRT